MTDAPTLARSVSEDVTARRRVAIALLGVIVILPGCNTSEIDSVRPNPTAARQLRDEIATAAAAAPTSSAQTETAGFGELASLKGQFVLDGAAAERTKITPSSDATVCGKHELFTETVTTGPDGGLANVCIWVPKLKPPAGTEVAEKVKLDNQGCRFEPHVLTMQAGQTLVLKNSDPVAHNTKGEPSNNKPFNVLISGNGEQEITSIKKAESKPFQVACNIHSWMKGYVVVADGPYAAVSGADGKFEIKGLPANRPLELVVWQEKNGWLTKVNINGEDQSWGQGKLKKTLKPGENDMGTIKVKLGGGA